jgi:hypothetical protein
MIHNHKHSEIQHSQYHHRKPNQEFSIINHSDNDDNWNGGPNSDAEWYTENEDHRGGRQGADRESHKWEKNELNDRYGSLGEENI